MRARLVGYAILFLSMSLSTGAADAATTVRALSLPPYSSFAIDTVANPISVDSNGVVTALIDEHAAYRWSKDGVRTRIWPTRVLPTGFGSNHDVSMNNVISASGGAYVSASSSFEGANMGTVFKVARWIEGRARTWHPPACLDSGISQDFRVYGVDGVRIGLTAQDKSSASISDVYREGAPRAFVIDRDRCLTLDRGVVTSLRGSWASGYREYAPDGKLKPSGIGSDWHDHIVAVRWHGSSAQELGTGIGLAISSDGFVVGCLPSLDQLGAVIAPDSRAIGWTANGHRIDFTPPHVRGVAYAVTDDDIVVGVVADSRGIWRAFRWRRGALLYLDDLAHPPGWHFETAYAATRDGTIVGIGTFKGRSTIFTWHE